MSNKSNNIKYSNKFVLYDVFNDVLMVVLNLQ